VLLKLIEERGCSSETCGLLGRVYKDQWEVAVRTGSQILAFGYLEKAVKMYLRGFEEDWRHPYPGVNAVTLMELRDPPDERQKELLPVFDMQFCAQSRRENPTTETMRRCLN